MKVILLATGLVVAAVGGWLMFDGWGIIQVERGWASFMAGSVLLSGGLLLAGLSAVVAELAHLRGALPGAVEVARPAAVAEPAVPEPIVSKPAAAEAPAPLAAPPAPPKADVKPAPRPQPPPDRKAPPPPAGFSPAPRPALRPIPPMAPTAAPPPPASLPSAPLPSAPPPSGPLPPGPPADPQGELTPDTRRGMSFEWLENAIKRDPDAPTGRVASEPAASDAPAEDASRLSRRFESHGVKYNLFNDGRIEAEADGQLHRFSSLTELRAFLDKRMKDQQGP